MRRYPDGVDGKAFFQKDAPSHMPDWIPTLPRARLDARGSARRRSGVDFPLVNDELALLWMVNMGCIDMNTWYSRIDRPDRPDFVLFDLDPTPEVPWAQTIEVALLVEELLDALGLASFPKTSGGKGFHVLVPLDRRSTYDDSRAFAELVAARSRARTRSSRRREWSKSRRRGVLIDANQNGEGKTIASVVLGAAAPGRAGLDAARVGRGDDDLDPAAFTMPAVLERVDARGDLYAGVLTTRQSLSKALRVSSGLTPFVTSGTARGRRPARREAAVEHARAGLVEHVVQVAALRALDARRAAVGARAAGDHPRRVGDPALELLEAALGDPDAAGVAVVDEDRRPAGLGVEVRREAADVPAVAHRPERQHRDQRVLGRVQRRRAASASRRARASCAGSGENQIASVAKVVGGQLERDELDPLLRGDRLALVADDLLGHLDLAEDERRARARRSSRSGRDDRRSRSPSSAACTSRRGTARRPRAASRSSSSLDEVRLAEVEVDGALVDGRVGARPLDEAEHRAGRRVDDRERSRGSAERSGDAARRGSRCRAQTKPRGVLLELRVGRRGARAPPAPRIVRVGVVDRRLVGRRADVAGEDARVRVVEDRRLDAPAEQLLRLAHEVLVERVLGRDEHREPVAAPAGAAPLLAQRRDRAREADRDHRVEQADVDPELERVGRRDAEQLALGEPPLDLAALLGACSRRGRARAASRRRAGRP